MIGNTSTTVAGRGAPYGARSLGEVLRADWKANPRDHWAHALLVPFRVAQWARGRFGQRHPLSLLFMVLYRAWAEGVCGVELRPGTTVGPGLTIYHRFGLVVNPESVIGSGVTLRHGVTIGHRDAGGKAPVIGDGVEVGASASIIGPITVGDGAVIAAGAVVVKDVPAGAIVAGNPARVLRIRG